MKRAKVKGPQTVRQFKRSRCLKDQRHLWVLGAATFASPSGQLGSLRRVHLKGECRRCREVRAFHPQTAIRPVAA